MLVSFYQGPVNFSSIALYSNLLLIHSSTAESRCPLTSLIPQSVVHSYELCRVFKERTTICFSFRDRLPGRVFDSARMWDVKKQMEQGHVQQCVITTLMCGQFAFCYNWRLLEEDVTVTYLLLIHLNSCNLFVVRNTIQHLHIVIRMINNVGMNHRKQPSADYKPIMESSNVKKQRSS